MLAAAPYFNTAYIPSDSGSDSDEGADVLLRRRCTLDRADLRGSGRRECCWQEMSFVRTMVELTSVPLLRSLS